MTIHADIDGVSAGQAAGIAFLRRSGRGAPLVLLHGIGSDSSSFVPLMMVLPVDRNIIAWSAPGYAMSAALPVDKPVPRDYVAALAQLLDALKLDGVVLVGHSLGCLFAAAFAAAAPARVKALALLSPALGYKTKPGAPLPPTVQARIDEIQSLGVEAFASKRAARLVYDAEHKPLVLSAVRNAMARINPAGYVQAVHALGAGDLLADVARIPAPTFVAVGREDVITPPANARATFDGAMNPAGYYEVPAAGHALPQENPGAVAELIDNIVRDGHA